MKVKVASRYGTAVLLLLFIWPALALAQAPRVERIEVIEAGFYTAQETGQTKDAPDSVGGRDTIAKNPKFLKSAPQDSARVGTDFGVRFRTIGHPSNAKVELRSVWKIPEPGIKDPKNGRVYRESVADFTTIVGTSHMRGYSFDEPWEVVRGVWTLQIWQDSRKLLERSFTIQ